MPRPLRPSIPLDVKLMALLRALGDAFAADMVQIAKEQRCLGTLVGEKQAKLAGLLNCAPNEIDYDHEPPLGARQKVFKKGIHVDYIPAANDSEYIFARARGDHRHKTNVAGKNGQHPDRVRIKKNRRLEKIEAARAGERKSAMLLPKPTRKKTGSKFHFAQNRARLRGRGFPPKGSRKIMNRGGK